MPKRLLRSIIEFDKEVTPEQLVRNFQRLRRCIEIEQFAWGRPEDDRLYKYLESFFTQYFEMPSAQTVLEHFEKIGGVEEIERLKDLQVERPRIRASFSSLLRELQEEQGRVRAMTLLKETAEILHKGIEDKKSGEVKKGVDDAILHFAQRSQELRLADTNVQIHGDIREDADKMKEEYDLAERDKGKVFGTLSGIDEIDEACKGAKKSELWIHAGFPGELKSTLAINWCYNAVTKFRKNVVYVSFEMPREQIRRNIFALHSANPRFARMGYEPLDYRSIRDGTLTKQEKEFYYELVVPDFRDNPGYTTFEVVTPDREWTMDDVRSHLELLHKEFEVGLVVLDHGQWIEARKARRNRDYTIELNSVINDSKRLALNFDHNNGVAVLMLFQINRMGKDEADKNEGVYRMRALTYANSCEKTADIITTTYLNTELRQQGRTKFTNLKNRDNPLFEPFEAHVNFSCRRILSSRRMEPKGFSVDGHDTYLNELDVGL
jgi:replicative DNA helicase